MQLPLCSFTASDDFCKIPTSVSGLECDNKGKSALGHKIFRSVQISRNGWGRNRNSQSSKYVQDKLRLCMCSFLNQERLHTTWAKSFRAISLSSFLLKTLERLIDRYIRDKCLINSLFILNNMRIQREDKQLVTRVEKAFDQKQILTLHVHGHNTSFLSI